MASSVRDVAVLAGVSVGTVSNVLNHPQRVAPDTVEKVRRAIAELGFVRNDVARQLRAGRSRTVGLVVIDVGNPFFTDLARGAEDHGSSEGLTVLLGNSDENATRESAYIASFIEQRVLGVLVSPVGEISEQLELLRSRGMPAVLVDRVSEDGRNSSVSVDDIAGGRLAVDHLLGLGHRRIGFVGGPSSIRQVADRLHGAHLAVEAYADATLEVLETKALSVLEGRDAGTVILNRGSEARPTGVFAANDLLAIGVLQALSLMGPQLVPHEVALIGYDDIDFAASAIVPLSSIRQPSVLMGQTAVDLLIREASDPALPHEQVVFQPELVVRESTAGPAFGDTEGSP